MAVKYEFQESSYYYFYYYIITTQSLFDFSVSLVPPLLDLCCENIKKHVAKQTDVELLPIPVQLKKYIATF